MNFHIHEKLEIILISFAIYLQTTTWIIELIVLMNTDRIRIYISLEIYLESDLAHTSLLRQTKLLFTINDNWNKFLKTC